MGYNRVMFAPVCLGRHCNGSLDVLHKKSMWIIIEKYNCKLINALWWLHVIGECNCRLPNAV